MVSFLSSYLTTPINYHQLTLLMHMLSILHSFMLFFLSHANISCVLIFVCNLNKFCINLNHGAYWLYTGPSSQIVFLLAPSLKSFEKKMDPVDQQATLGSLKKCRGTVRGSIKKLGSRVRELDSPGIGTRFLQS